MVNNHHSYHSSAPGSLMLLGEYAVLNGKNALVCAIDKRIHVTIIPRKDNQLYIHSALGQYRGSIHPIRIESPLEFVLTTLQSKSLPTGCEIIIEAEFASDLGLGSSAAVTVALQRALNHWLKQTALTKEQLWHETFTTIQRVQGNGSGADLAASIYGGIITFQNSPLRITPLKNIPPICAIYSGNKTTTKKAIDKVRQQREQMSDFFQKMDDEVNQLSHQAVPAINQADWQTLGRLFNCAQDYMNRLGTSNETLDNIIQTLQQVPTIYGAKISGSGFGDCVVGLGKLEHKIFPHNEKQRRLGVKQISTTITPMGVADEH